MGSSPGSLGVGKVIADAAEICVRREQTTYSVNAFAGEVLLDPEKSVCIAPGCDHTCNRWAFRLAARPAQREYMKAVWSGAIKSPIKSRITAHFWPDPVYAATLNEVYSLSSSAALYSEHWQNSTAGWADWSSLGSPPSAGK